MKSFLPKKLLSTKILVAIYLVLAVLLFSSAFLELYQSERDLLALLKKQAHTLLETAVVASQNTLLTNTYMESFLEERLLNNAFYLKYLYERHELTPEQISEFARKNHLYRINIWSADGRRLLSSHPGNQSGHPPPTLPKRILAPLFSGQQDTLIIGLKQARHQPGVRYAVAVATKDRAAIVINLNAAELLEFRRQIGIGRMLQNISRNPGVVYVAIQDSSGILAASQNVDSLDSIGDSPFLQNAITHHRFVARLGRFQGKEILEAAMPLFDGSFFVGLMRAGFSLAELQAIKHRIYRRIGIITTALLFVGILMLTLLFSRQSLELLRKQYHLVETYSSTIIHSVSDGILVLDSEQRIILCNRAAAELFHIDTNSAIGQPLAEYLEPETCSAMLNLRVPVQEIECRLGGQPRTLLLSKSEFTDADGRINHVLVIRDLTEQKNLERRIQRQEQLTAMGELASGVAHEIRNPLNTIGTIVQQLDKDFEPVENGDDFHRLARLVHKEVLRINRTIEDFLRFSRPEPLRVSSFRLSTFLEELIQQYSSLAAGKKIELQKHLEWDGEVRWDREKMRQVLMNLLQNAIEAIGENGTIRLWVRKLDNNRIQVRVKDTGPGISPELQKKIFNLYFTTKARGTGIGLSVVQQIVNEHDGAISVDSIPGEGTEFILELPISVEGSPQSGAPAPDDTKGSERKSTP